MSKLAKALSASAGNAGGDKLYVEDVFSTFLYDGTGTTNNIVNGVDLTEGGLVWFKTRDDVEDHNLVDSERGSNKGLESNTADAETGSAGFSTFNSNGFTLTGGFGKTNSTSSTYASWTFRKAKKFFDVVTFTGTGAAQNISHSLGSVPAMIFCKSTSNTENWYSYNKDLNGGTNPEQYWVELDTTSAQQGPNSAFWNNTAPTDTQFTVGTAFPNGYTYVAYLFASDAGGYGDDGTENIIKCGTYTEAASSFEVTLGWEPQFILAKASSKSGDWYLLDTMRGFNHTTDNRLEANNSVAEDIYQNYWSPTATGFNTPAGYWGAGTEVIYMAIRRPMKTPTVGTEVYTTIARAGNNVTTQIPTGFTTDMFLSTTRNLTWYHAAVWDRLRGTSKFVLTSTTGTEQGNTAQFTSFDQDGITVGPDGSGWINNASANYVYNLFKRATGFMDVVAYTGNGTAGATQAHNLGVVPEMLIVKRRNATDLWPVYHATLGNTKYLQLNGDVPEGAWSGNWNNTTPTASVFSLGNGSYTNASSSTYVAYLFATLAGISKVGSYTGTGSSLNVDCGFTGGARFILIRRYNYPSGGSDWYTWDSVRGISAGNDPYLLLNDEAVEVTGTDYVAPLNAGFTVTSNASSTVNVNGGTYIFLAIA